MRGQGGSLTEPIVIELSDEAGRLVDQVLAYALDSPMWTESERRAIEGLRLGLVSAGVKR